MNDQSDSILLEVQELIDGEWSTVERQRVSRTTLAVGESRPIADVGLGYRRLLRTS